MLSLATTIATVIFSSRDISLSLIDFSLSHGVVSNRKFWVRFVGNLLGFRFVRKAEVGF